MKGVVTLQQSRHCAASSSTAAVAALPALRILCLFAVVLFPSAAHNYRGYLRLSCSERNTAPTLCHRTMMSLPYGDVF